MFLSRKKRLLRWAIIIAIIFAAAFHAKLVREILRDITFSKTDSEGGTYAANDNWQALRQTLLSNQSVSKAIILAHTRGGSSLCSDIFNIEANGTVLWYEALRGFHSFYSGLTHASKDWVILLKQNLTMKISNPSKRMALADYFIQMLNCDIENLPTELLTMTPFISRSRALKKFAKCVALRNAYHTHQVCFSLLQKFQKYMNVLERGLGVLSSYAKRENLLKTMRNWKPDAINDNSTLELLRRYIVDHNAMELKSRIEKSCPNLLSNSMNHNITSFKNMDMLKLTNECDLLEYKFYKFIEHYDCFMNLTRTISGCRGLLQEPCDRMKLVVAEVQRVALSDLEPLIIRMPDIHIVHYVRDPRAISVSRAERRFLKFKNEPSWTIVDEAELLCERMRCDTKEKKRLQQIYPDSIITLRYEDLVLEPLITVTKMYRYFGRPVPLEINEWIDSRLHGTSDNGPYGVHRVDGRKHLTDWRSIATKNDTLSMNELCKDVLLEYNYDF